MSDEHIITKRRVGAHISKQQKIKLHELMKENINLRLGKFSSTFTTKDAARAWEEIASQLNAIPGAKKVWKAWRKTWQDIFSKLKGKQGKVNRDWHQTICDPPLPSLIDLGPTRERNLELKKERLMDAALNLFRSDIKLNAFGVYIGKKIEEIEPGQQRDLAEKLISDVIFLAKSNCLTLDTKIEIPSSRCTSSNFGNSPQQSSSKNNSNRQSTQIQSPSSPTQNNPLSPVSSHSVHDSPATSPPPPHSPVPVLIKEEAPTITIFVTKDWEKQE